MQRLLDQSDLDKSPESPRNNDIPPNNHIPERVLELNLNRMQFYVLKDYLTKVEN